MLTGGPLPGRSPACGTSALSDRLGIVVIRFHTQRRMYSSDNSPYRPGAAKGYWHASSMNSNLRSLRRTRFGNSTICPCTSSFGNLTESSRGMVGMGIL